MHYNKVPQGLILLKTADAKHSTPAVCFQPSASLIYSLPWIVYIPHQNMALETNIYRISPLSSCLCIIHVKDWAESLRGWNSGPKGQGRGPAVWWLGRNLIHSSSLYWNQPQGSPGHHGWESWLQIHMLLKCCVVVGVFCGLFHFKSQKAVGVAMCPINQHTTQCLY